MMAGVLETLTVPRASALPSASLAPIAGSSFSIRVRFSEFRGLKLQETRSSSPSLSSCPKLARRGSRIVCKAQDTPVKGKDSWPELLGEDGDKAKAIIEKENPLVTAVIILEGSPVTGDLDFGRVRVVVNKNNVVIQVPHIG